eukprot:scaffold7615_cov286-Pinguiococcus_pyrenoidosus.AAC.11
MAHLNLLPQIPWGVCTFNRLHVQKAFPLVLTDGRVSTVRQGTRLSIAVAGDVVLVSAERLLLANLRLEAAEPVVDDLPNHLAEIERLLKFDTEPGFLPRRSHLIMLHVELRSAS